MTIRYECYSSVLKSAFKRTHGLRKLAAVCFEPLGKLKMKKKKIQTNDTTAISIHCTNYNRPLEYLVTSHTIQYTPLHCPATARAAFNIAASSSNRPSTAIHPWLGLRPRYHMNLFPYFIKKINRSANCVVTLSKLTLSWNGHKYRNINMAY